MSEPLFIWRVSWRRKSPFGTQTRSRLCHSESIARNAIRALQTDQPELEPLELHEISLEVLEVTTIVRVDLVSGEGVVCDPAERPAFFERVS